MEDDMMENGRMGSSMEQEFLLIRMVKREELNEKMEKKLNGLTKKLFHHTNTKTKLYVIRIIVSNQYK